MKNDNFKTRVTIYEVAKKSGYSLATVSRVINNKSNVKEDTKAKILETIEKLGYKPSALAQGLAMSKSRNIGIVLPSNNYVYISNMLSGMADIAKIYGYQTTLFLTKSDRDEVKDAIEKLIKSHVDGAVLFDDSLTEEDFKEIEKYQIPSVFIGHDFVGEMSASVSLNYENELRTIVREHFKNGDEPLNFVKLSNAGELSKIHEEIVRDEMMKLNKLDLFNSILLNDFYNETLEYFETYFKTHRKGFYVSPRDSVSCAILNAALDNGLDIPKDVQIFSIIGTKYSRIIRPQLSSIDIDMYEVGSISMRMLTKLLDSELKNKNYVFEGVIEHRSSTR